MNDVASFRALHAQARVLLLPNAWDAGSAVLMIASGAQAVATSSAGVAWACGYPDGDVLPRERLLQAVAAICRVCAGAPVSVDIEGGYSDDPHEVVELVSRLRQLGVVGINLEDGSGNPALLTAKIEAIAASVDIFINARTDVFLRELVPDGDAAGECIPRVQRYARAGASGIFVPAVHEPAAIRELARATDLPLSILAEPGLPAIPELYALGVRRLSAGSALAKLAYGQARAAARDFLQGNSAEPLFAGDVVEYAEMNALTARHQRAVGGV